MQYSQLTEHYGVDIASDILDRARSTTSLLNNTTARSSPDPDKDPFASKSDSHAGRPIHRAF